jgi:hypothetical protein
VYVHSTAVGGMTSSGIAPTYLVNIKTGTMSSPKTFGSNLPSGVRSVSGAVFSRNGSAYAYVYVQDLSQAYVVSGLK